MNLTKLIKQEAPAFIPPGFRSHPLLKDGAIYRDTIAGLRILLSKSQTDDQKWWWHFSFSRQDRIPSWEEMREAIYDLPFFDKTREVFMTLPPKNQYINLNPYVMHWWQEIL